MHQTKKATRGKKESKVKILGEANPTILTRAFLVDIQREREGNGIYMNFVDCYYSGDHKERNFHTVHIETPLLLYIVVDKREVRRVVELISTKPVDDIREMRATEVKPLLDFLSPTDKKKKEVVSWDGGSLSMLRVSCSDHKVEIKRSITDLLDSLPERVYYAIYGYESSDKNYEQPYLYELGIHGLCNFNIALRIPKNLAGTFPDKFTNYNHENDGVLSKILYNEAIDYMYNVYSGVGKLTHANKKNFCNPKLRLEAVFPASIEVLQLPLKDEQMGIEDISYIGALPWEFKILIVMSVITERCKDYNKIRASSTSYFITLQVSNLAFLYNENAKCKRKETPYPVCWKEVERLVTNSHLVFVFDELCEKLVTDMNPLRIRPTVVTGYRATDFVLRFDDKLRSFHSFKAIAKERGLVDPNELRQANDKYKRPMAKVDEFFDINFTKDNTYPLLSLQYEEDNDENFEDGGLRTQRSDTGTHPEPLLRARNLSSPSEQNSFWSAVQKGTSKEGSSSSLPVVSNYQYTKSQIEEAKSFYDILNEEGVGVMASTIASVASMPLLSAFRNMQNNNEITNFALRAECKKNGILPPYKGHNPSWLCNPPPSVIPKEIVVAIGGMVISMFSGVREFVFCYDFKSMYPRILLFLNLNLGKLALKPIVTKYLRMREKYKEYGNNSGQKIAKLLANALIGCLNSRECEFESKNTAADITSLGQFCIQKVVVYLASRGYEVLNVQTDSVFFAHPKSEGMTLYGIESECVLSGFTQKMEQEINTHIFEQLKAHFRLRADLEIDWQKGQSECPIEMVFESFNLVMMMGATNQCIGISLPDFKNYHLKKQKQKQQQLRTEEEEEEQGPIPFFSRDLVENNSSVLLTLKSTEIANHGTIYVNERVDTMRYLAEEAAKKLYSPSTQSQSSSLMQKSTNDNFANHRERGGGGGDEPISTITKSRDAMIREEGGSSSKEGDEDYGTTITARDLIDIHNLDPKMRNQIIDASPDGIASRIRKLIKQRDEEPRRSRWFDYTFKGFKSFVYSNTKLTKKSSKKLCKAILWWYALKVYDQPFLIERTKFWMDIPRIFDIRQMCLSQIMNCYKVYLNRSTFNEKSSGGNQNLRETYIGSNCSLQGGVVAVLKCQCALNGAAKWVRYQKFVSKNREVRIDFVAIYNEVFECWNQLLKYSELSTHPAKDTSSSQTGLNQTKADYVKINNLARMVMLSYDDSQVTKLLNNISVGVETPVDLSKRLTTFSVQELEHIRNTKQRVESSLSFGPAFTIGDSDVQEKLDRHKEAKESLRQHLGISEKDKYQTKDNVAKAFETSLRDSEKLREELFLNLLKSMGQEARNFIIAEKDIDSSGIALIGNYLEEITKNQKMFVEDQVYRLSKYPSLQKQETIRISDYFKSFGNV